MDQRKRWTLLAVVGAVIALLGCVALTITEPGGSPRAWAIALAIGGICIAVVSLVSRSAPPAAPLQRPRRSSLFMAALGALGLVTLPLGSTAGWSSYALFGYLVVAGLGMYAFDRRAIRKRGAPARREQPGPPAGR